MAIKGVTVPEELPINIIDLTKLRTALVQRGAELDKDLATMNFQSEDRPALVTEKHDVQATLKTVNQALAHANRRANAGKPPAPFKSPTKQAHDRRREQDRAVVHERHARSQERLGDREAWTLKMAAGLVAGNHKNFHGYLRNGDGRTGPFYDIDMLKKDAEDIVAAIAPHLFPWRNTSFVATKEQVTAAQETYGAPGVIEFDDDAEVSNDDKGGVWVHGWVHLDVDPSPPKPKWEQGVDDSELTAEELDHKYNPDGDGEHPVYRRELWGQAVSRGDTSLGYWAWVEWCFDTDDEDDT